MALKPGLLIVVAGGAVVAYAGYKGFGIGSTIRNVITGQKPDTNQQLVNQITGDDPSSGGTVTTGTGSVSVSGKANQAIARTLLMAQHPSWAVGQQWTDLVSLWTKESGWSSTAFNTSGAYGIAQFLGHATAGESAVGPRSVASTTPGLNNAYGGFGLSAVTARAANAGHALPQIQAGIFYIEAQYGSPSAAWAHETANNWY